jgi:spoIIIJ-associated protein
MPEGTARTPGDEAAVIVQEILGKMGLSALATVADETEDQVTIDMAGNDIGILIGRHGETLQALQLIVGGIFHRRTGSSARILVDAEGYRERRAEQLRQRARHIADQVRESGREAVLDSLTAYERRIVHLELADDPDVYTYSEGEGDNRSLVISPKE